MLRAEVVEQRGAAAAKGRRASFPGSCVSTYCLLSNMCVHRQRKQRPPAAPAAGGGGRRRAAAASNSRTRPQRISYELPSLVPSPPPANFEVALCVTAAVHYVRLVSTELPSFLTHRSSNIIQ
ncbi:hypothetical protein EVAR_56701_1 [Eumeta japonica]|uniref:Uncharacterized protein n=1 Tax=Eumeta variegata TaxID=151549 RepID=A0A4C1Y1K3_EUMVA|nr:hypothetical protein EVAR_56701_1 [Eumeta japonica]